MVNKSEEMRALIGNRLAVARKHAGLSQAQVAQLLGLPRPSITEIEAGRRRVSAEELVQFAEVYSVDLDWLAGRTEGQADALRDRLLLAARDVANLKSEDLEKVIALLTSLKPKGDD